MNRLSAFFSPGGGLICLIYQRRGIPVGHVKLIKGWHIAESRKVDHLKTRDPNMLRLGCEKISQSICERPPKFVSVPPWEKIPQPGKAYWIPIMIIPSKGKVRNVFDAANKFRWCLPQWCLPARPRLQQCAPSSITLLLPMTNCVYRWYSEYVPPVLGSWRG